MSALLQSWQQIWIKIKSVLAETLITPDQLMKPLKHFRGQAFDICREHNL